MRLIDISKIHRYRNIDTEISIFNHFWDFKFRPAVESVCTYFALFANVAVSNLFVSLRFKVNTLLKCSGLQNIVSYNARCFGIFKMTVYIFGITTLQWTSRSCCEMADMWGKLMLINKQLVQHLEDKWLLLTLEHWYSVILL